MTHLNRVALAIVLAAALGACRGSRGGTPAPPVANAGTDQTVWRGDAVTLDGGASAGGAGATLSFRWRQSAGPAVALSDDRAARPTFVAPRQTTVLGFVLEVSDGVSTSAPDDVVVAVQNRAPRADAGADQVAATGEVVTLTPRASADPDGDPLTATWYQAGGPEVTLVPHVDGSATFVAPAVAASLEFALVVGDGEAISAPSPVRVQVVDRSANWPPVANAGPDGVVPWRSVVQLTGSAVDREGDPLTWTWVQTAGPSVALLGADTATASFVAPAQDGDVELELVASDGHSNGADRVTVSVRNQAPRIEALALAPATPVTTDPLVASATVADADQDPLTLAWEWRRNGVLLEGQTGSTLPASLTTRGDVFLVRVTASDGPHTTSAEATVTIGDSPAVLELSAPATARWGEAMAFTVTGSDPDGDPVGDLVLVHGPAGMTLSPSGTGAWTPTLPMFDRSLDVRFAVGIAGDAATTREATIRVEDPGRAYPLRRSGVEIPAAAGLVAADLDGDGRKELLVAGRTGLYELAFAGTGYVQRWMYPFSVGGGAAGAVEARDLDGDGAPEIFFSAVPSSGGSGAGVLLKLDGATRREAARAERSCLDLEAADVDGDGRVELACLSGTSSWGGTQKLVLLDAATLAVRWETAELGLGSSLAIGNVDRDAALEIVTAGGYVFDGATGANEWAYAGGFGVAVDTGDLDGDGVEELVGMDAWNRFRGFSAVAKAPVWEQAVFDSDALLVADMNGDGVPEIVVGDGQWGNVTAWRYRPATNDLQSVFQLNSQDHGVTALAVGDLDGDGALEIAWGSGATSSGEDVFVVAGTVPQASVEWKNVDPSQLDGPFLGAKLARTAAGAPAGLLFEVPRTDSGYAGSRLVRLDPDSGDLALSAEIGTNWSRAGALDVADYDADGVDEVFMATASLYDGYLVAWDFAAGTASWTSSKDVGSVAAVTHADLNADGAPDLVAIAATGHVMAFDVLHQTLIWKSTGIGSGVDVEVGDLDGDGAPEIVALASDRVVLFRKGTGAIPWIEAASASLPSTSTGVVDLALGDCDGDGKPEIHVLAGGSVLRFDGALAAQGRFAVRGAAVSLFVEDLGAGRKNLVLGKGEASTFAGVAGTLEAVDPVSGAQIWESPPLWGAPARNSLSYVDPGGGRPRIALGTSTGMIVTR